MSGEESDTEKEHEPTQKRLDDARQRGEVPHSADLAVAASYAGLLLAGAVSGLSILTGIGQAGMVLLDQADSLASGFLSAGRAPVWGVLSAIGLASAPLFLLPMVAVVLAVIAQRSFVVAPEKLAFKLSRVSPLATLKHKYGREGLFEFAKSFAKLAIFSVILGLFLVVRAPDLLATLHMSPALATGVMVQVMMEFLFLVLLVSVGIGVLDYFWQRAQHIHRNKMSRQEVIDEQKDAEGDPHTKAERRQRGQEIANNRMMQDVPSADVIVVNPTHYAIALKWNRAARGAPVCVAKGVDEIAARIREEATRAGVPIHSDPPTARAIYASVAIGDQIHPDHYRAVAAAIRFAEAMRKRRKALIR